jgi:hypothetical protein
MDLAYKSDTNEQKNGSKSGKIVINPNGRI